MVEADADSIGAGKLIGRDESRGHINIYGSVGRRRNILYKNQGNIFIMKSAYHMKTLRFPAIAVHCG